MDENLLSAKDSGSSDGMLSRIEPELVAAIRRIVRAVDLHSRRLVEEFGLTGPQLAALQAAERTPGASPSAIARVVHLSHATVTGILHRLSERGLVERRKSPTDRRGVQVFVTDAGSRLLERAPSLLQTRFREEFGRLEAWERLMILSVLERVGRLMESPAPAPGQGPTVGLSEMLADAALAAGGDPVIDDETDAGDSIAN